MRKRLTLIYGPLVSSLDHAMLSPGGKQKRRAKKSQCLTF